VRGMNISLGNEETKCNGHRSMVELIEITETMKILRVEVYIYRVDNYKIIKAREEANHINTQLLESLNQL
jgi:hypothetical protein